MHAWFGLILALLAVVAGLGLGGLNAQPVTLHLLVTDLEATLGVMVVGALVLGVLLGAGAVYLARVLPLRFRLRQALREVDGGGTETETGREVSVKGDHADDD